MKVRRMYSGSFTYRWRWEAAGLFGYCATKRGALKAARRAIENERANR